MVPRPKIFALDVDDAPERGGHASIVESGFSRIPAYDGSLDNMIGVVYIKDALRLLEKRQPVVLRKILHPVHFVPETKKVGRAPRRSCRSGAATWPSSSTSTAPLTRPRDARGPARGDRGRDPGRVRLGGAARSRSQRDGSLVVDGTVPAAELRERPTRSRSPSPRSSRPWPASCSSVSASLPQGRRGRHGGRLPLHGGRRREEPDQQGQDRQGPATVRSRALAPSRVGGRRRITPRAAWPLTSRRTARRAGRYDASAATATGK